MNLTTYPITCILNGYKRKQNLREQLNALKNQSFKPENIWLWYNHPDDCDLIDEEITTIIPTCLNNINWGVWARFAFALNSNTKYVCVFDDDTIPGKKWLENCYNTIQTNNGLLGTIGLIWSKQAKQYLDSYIRFGWNDNNNEQTIRVDIVGHCWFFEREWLSHFWRELPDYNYLYCGEDMHFSYMLQKYGNINTFVPPHPINDKELWGSIKGGEYGGDKNSLWETNKEDFRNKLNQYFIKQRNAGWKLIEENK